jgi:outer membrane protein TolC
MFFRRRFTCLLIVLAGTGCMFHGNTPVAKAPEAFSVGNTDNPVKNLAEHPWWEEVGSAELNELVLEALESNKKVSIAIKNIETAQSSLDTVRLGWLPMVSLMAGRVKSSGAVQLPSLPVSLSSSGGFAAFLPMWVANIVQLPNQTKEAQKKVEATASEYLALRAAIAAQVVSGYAVLLASIEEESLLSALKDNLTVRLMTTRAMTDQGLDTEVSFNNLDSEMQKLEGQIATNKSNKIAAKNALLILVGRQISTFTPREKFSTLNLNQIAPGNTPTSVLETRPDVVAARAKIEAADYGVSATASLFAPTPTFMTANARVAANNNGVDGTANANMQAGLALWVLDPKYLGKISTQNKQYDASIINYLEVVDNAMKEVDDALASFEANQTKLIKEERSLANSRRNLSTTKAMFKNGLLSNTQYLESSARFDSASMTMLQTKVQTIIALSKLYQSMGGGATYGEKNYSLKDQTIVGKDRETTEN